MGASRFTRAVVLGLALLPGVVAAKVEWTLYDDLTLGRDRYSSNTVDLGVAPVPEASADLSFGTTRSNTPVSDSTHQFGIGLWGEAGPAVTISANYLGYTGDKASVLNGFGDVVGEVNDRIKTATFGGKIGIRLLRPGENDEIPVALRLDLGMMGGRETMPIYVALPPLSPTLPPPPPRKLGRTYDIRDREYTAGLYWKVDATSVTATYSRHHYTDNMNAIEEAFDALTRNRPVLRRMLAGLLEGIRYNTQSVAQGQPKYDSCVSLTQRFLRDWAITASFDYQEMTERGALAREPGADLAWEAASWIEVRLGGFVVNQFGKKTRYATAGVSLFF